MPRSSARVGDPLKRYSAKRDFKVTPEPTAVRRKAGKVLSFVIQKHWASRLHYDFRLELDGVLLSWAVPKGPCFDPKEKRIAIHVEDHPVGYGGFEGTIPPKQYGAGKVIVWDRGTWEPVGDPREGMAKGKLVFALHGEKLAGLWELVRISKPVDRQDQWMLFKKRDAWARPLTEYDVITALPDSVVDKPLGRLEDRRARSAQRSAKPLAAAADGRIAGAVEAVLPAKLVPQKATLARSAPTAGGWIFEIKFDGYRIMARIAGGEARIFTSGGHDWTAKMKPLADELRALGVEAWLDGEAVVLDDEGRPDFSLLQNAFDSAQTGSIVYFVFDVPFFEGHDLRKAPLYARRALLEGLLERKGTERIRFSEDFPGDARSVVEAACAMRLEGIIAKRADAPYVCARTETWLKLKCSARQEFVVVGFTERAGANAEVGALLLGYHDEHGRLRHGGSVGTGWNAEAGADLRRRLAKLEVDAPSVDPASAKPGRWSRHTAASVHWVKPKLVAEVSFSEWTPDGHIRRAVFRGLRSDKPAAAITRETARPFEAGEPHAAAAAPAARRGARRVGSVTVSNPERVIDPTTGLRKLDLVHYYESIAERMLPHLRDRPVSLLRAPEGIAGEHFFQKHPETKIPGLTELDPKLWPGHAALLAVDSADALVSAAQMNVVEFHTWNSTTRAIDRPDRIVFDLDPGEGVRWTHVQEAALLTRALLAELGLESRLKTSGGKGLHVVVPIAPRLPYDVVKDFSQEVVQHLARTIPSRFVARSGAANRVGRIFVDYLRNGHGQTTVAAFSARARPGMGVSMPVAWDELPSLKSGSQWTIATAREYLSFQSSDPWADDAPHRQTLTGAMKTLRFGPGGGKR